MRKIHESCAGCLDREVRMTLGPELLCAACRKKERNRKWHAEHPGQNAARAKAWREAGNKSPRSDAYREKHRQRERDRYANDAEHRERQKENARMYRQANQEKVKISQRAWMQKNQEKYRPIRRQRAAKNRLERNSAHARQLDAQTVWRTNHWAIIEGRNDWVRRVDEIRIEPGMLARLHAWQEEHCYICNGPYGKNERTVEHIIPRSLGGPNHPQNLVHTCRKCNFSRQARLLNIDWTPSEIVPVNNRFYVRFDSIKKDLADHGIKAEPDEATGAWILNDNKRLFIANSFWCSDRNPSSRDGKIMISSQEQFPGGIFIIDYEWYARKNAIINMLKSKLMIAERSAQARQLEIVAITQEQSNIFLEANHVMGKINAPYRYGLTNGQDLFGVALFSEYDSFYDCVRMAFRGHVPGGMSKLMADFRSKHPAKPIISFIDSRYANGDGHEVVGFQHVEDVPPTFKWIFPDKMQHQRFLSNDQKAARSLIYFNPDLDLADNIAANGVYRMWTPAKRKLILS